MKALPMTLAVMAWSLLAACGARETGPRHADDGDSHHAHDEADEHEDRRPSGPAAAGTGRDHGAEANRVRISKSMLRDLRVVTAAAQALPAGEIFELLGEVRAHPERSAVATSPTTARIVRVYVLAGDEVAAGQALADLEAPAIGSARAEAEHAAARLALAQSSLKRIRELAQENLAATKDVLAAEAELAQAQAAHGGAEGHLQALGAGKGPGARWTLRAPRAGTVLRRAATVGRMADAEEPLFEIADLHRLWLTVHAYERDAVRIQPGVAVAIQFPAYPGETWEGTITRLAPLVDPVSRTVDVQIEIANPDGRLSPGMSATARVPARDARAAMLVPLEAVQRCAAGWCVFLPHGGPGEFEVRAVGRGRTLDTGVEVLSGLNPGESIVVEGAFLLKAEAAKAAGGGEEHEHH